VARTAGLRAAPRMIQGVLMGGLLLARPWVHASVVLEGCGPEVPTAAASFLASRVALGVSAVGWAVPDSSVVGFLVPVGKALKGRWCCPAWPDFSTSGVPAVLQVAGFLPQCVGFLLLLPEVGFPGRPLDFGGLRPIALRFPGSWPGVDGGPR